MCADWYVIILSCRQPLPLPAFTSWPLTFDIWIVQNVNVVKLLWRLHLAWSRWALSDFSYMGVSQQKALVMWDGGWRWKNQSSSGCNVHCHSAVSYLMAREGTPDTSMHIGFCSACLFCVRVSGSTKVRHSQATSIFRRRSIMASFFPNVSLYSFFIPWKMYPLDYTEQVALKGNWSRKHPLLHKYIMSGFWVASYDRRHQGFA